MLSSQRPTIYRSRWINFKTGLQVCKTNVPRSLGTPLSFYINQTPINCQRCSVVNESNLLWALFCICGELELISEFVIKAVCTTGELLCVLGGGYVMLFDTLLPCLCYPPDSGTKVFCLGVGSSARLFIEQKPRFCHGLGLLVGPYQWPKSFGRRSTSG